METGKTPTLNICAELPQHEVSDCCDVRKAKHTFVITTDGTGAKLTKIIGLTLYFSNGIISGKVVLDPTTVKTLKRLRKRGCNIGIHFP